MRSRNLPASRAVERYRNNGADMLTIRSASRFLFTCEALSTTQEVYAFTMFERVFEEFGLPKAIRTSLAYPSPVPMPCSA